MLKLNASFSKKVPVPGQDYSSQSFHASVEMELSDGNADALKAKIHDAFAMVRATVEEEIAGNGKAKEAPVTGNAVLTPVTSSVTAATPVKDDKALASNKQLRYIADLSAQQKVGLAELNARIAKSYGCEGLYALTKSQASDLLKKLKAA